MLKGNYKDYIEKKDDGNVRIKKYYHVLRRILLNRWLHTHGPDVSRWPPPCTVLDLLASAEEDPGRASPVPAAVSSMLRARLEPEVRIIRMQLFSFINDNCFPGRVHCPLYWEGGGLKSRYADPKPNH